MAPLFASIRLPHRLAEWLADPPLLGMAPAQRGNARQRPAARAQRLLEATAAVHSLAMQRLPETVWLGASHACVPTCTGTHVQVQGALERLRAELTARHGLPVACGLARTRLAADIAARLVAPAGLLHVLPGYERRVLAPVSLRWLDGMDRRTLDRCAAHGLHTCGDLADAPDDLLRRIAGGTGLVLGRLARGDDARSVPSRPHVARWTVEFRHDDRPAGQHDANPVAPGTVLLPVSRALHAAWTATRLRGGRPVELRLAFWSGDLTHADGRGDLPLRGTAAPLQALATTLLSRVLVPPAWARAFVTVISVPDPAWAASALPSDARASGATGCC